MKIAFISYEYPPDTADGGVATYIYQAARMLSDRGHAIEVFCGSRERTGVALDGAVRVHRIHAKHGEEFTTRIASVFAARHALSQFDVLEGPEWRGEAYHAVRQVPDIPLVLKLHTPTYLLMQMNKPPLGSTAFLTQAKTYLGAKRRGQRPYWEADEILERRHAKDADEIAAPSYAIGEDVARAWRLDPALISYVPLPYTPVPALLDIPVETDTGVVTFLGRLEVRKGVLDLARAIPLVLRQFPQAKFRFVGRSMDSPRYKVDMRRYLEQQLRPCQSAVEFPGAVPLEAVPSVLAESDICVFPSIWESYGFVCLEAMAAARGVIGSSAGGMAELLDGGNVGLLVPPHRPEKIAEAIVQLLSNPAERKALGRKARERALREYNLGRIGRLQEESYLRAIQRRQTLGARVFK